MGRFLQLRGGEKRALAMAARQNSPPATNPQARNSQKLPKNIRNICILAHVDHGKTTLADHLIAAGGGGVLHPKQAGKLRYLDYRDDEQLRAITMKSSSIALHFRDHLINLIDSPGHVDFCSEVSTAARLSDGALVLVDVCEGVHIQTHAVLRQAWMEKVVPCLVLNKIDRLITELKLSPAEAYNRLQGILMEVNNIINAFRSEKYLSDVDSILAGTVSPMGSGMENGMCPDANEHIDTNLEEDEEDAFALERGNVVFACALDGWAFRIDQFAALYAAKLGASQTALKKALWGDYYYMPKTKKIVGKKASGGKGKPMFVQFILEPLWQVYDAGLQGLAGQEMLNKIIKSMGLTIPARDLQHKDPKVVLQAVMSRWLPLAETIFSMVVECLPDPVFAQSERIVRFFPEHNASVGVREEVAMQLEIARNAVKMCDNSVDAPCVVFVSKMFAVPLELLPRRGPDGELIQNMEAEMDKVGDVGHQECFLAFARVFSGILFAGQKVLILSPLYDPTKGEEGKKYLQEAVVQGVYMMMGRGLEPKAFVSAGNLVAIRGLGQHILKTGTLTTTPFCWPFKSMTYQAAPIMRVAIEPSDPVDIGALTRGLRLLNRADPFVEVSISGTGEHVIAAAGEVHLERCIKDLKERFARVELEVSAPLVAFKETIEMEGISSGELSRSTSLSEVVEKSTANGRCTVRVHATRLPPALTEVLDESTDILQRVIEGNASNSSLKDTSQINESFMKHQGDAQDPLAVLRHRLIAAAHSEVVSGNRGNERHKGGNDAKTWLNRLERIWSLGPRQVGPNLLLTPVSWATKSLQGVEGHSEGTSVADNSNFESVLIKGAPHVSERLGIINGGSEVKSSVGPCSSGLPLLMEAEALENSVISGFQLATAAGPLCEEPMWGLAFTVEAVVYARGKGMAENGEVGVAGDDGIGALNAEQYGPFSGQVMTAVKDACRLAMLAKSPRLVEAMYFCEVSTPTEFLGQMYGVLGKRRARVLKEEMREGSAMFTVHAYMPVAESFGFTDEMRRKTSGAASPQLVLSHWEALPQDPFFVPRTEEELEEYGDGSSVPPNTARKLIDAVRRRKGLPVEEKVVQYATKQRTLARKV